jgi:hypothetical protein
MESIVLIPGIIAALWGLRFGPVRVFLNFYLPTLFLLPEYYRWTVPGIPKVTFSQPVILVTAYAIWSHGGFKRWKFTLTDVLVFCFVASFSISEYVNKGYKESQNLTFDMLAWFLLPYIVAKAIVEPMGQRVAFMRRVVQLMAAIAVISLFEFRMGMTPFQFLLSRFFPYQGTGWVTTFRWGFARIAGPYGHAILCGLIFVIAYRLQRWLEWHHCWEDRFRRIPLPFDKGFLLRLALLAGSLMSMVRGPWIGGILGAAFAIIGNSVNPRRASIRVGLIVLAIGVPTGAAFYSYVSVGRANAKSVSQESAAYRKELVDKYLTIAEDQAWLGYGRSNFPIVAGMSSIDNYYLLLSLWHGFIASGLLIILLFGTTIRLFRRGLLEADLGFPRPSLAFTLAGILSAVIFTLATVYMGTQVIPIVAMLLGWSDAYLLGPMCLRVSGATASVEPVTPLRFTRVVT